MRETFSYHNNKRLSTSKMISHIYLCKPRISSHNMKKTMRIKRATKKICYNLANKTRKI